MTLFNSNIRTRKNKKNNVGKKFSRLALVAFVLIIAVRENGNLFANARPFGEADGKGAEMMVRGMNASDIHQGTTQELLQELVNALEKQQGERQEQSRSSGFYGIHPLPRRRSNAEPLEERQGVLPQIIPAVSQAASSGSDDASSAAQPAASSAAPASSASPSSQASATPSNTNSASPSATSKPAQSTQSASKTDSPSSSSSSNKSSPTQSDDSGSGSSDGVGSLFSTHNKLFPVAIVLAVVMVLGALLVLVSIGKFISHRKMAKEKREGTRKFDSRDNDYMIASVGKVDINRKRTLGRSIKRALTRGRIGGSSFARREREGTVLIDVGDEVLAVTPAVAKEYERERKSCLSSYQSSVSNGGSRLTFPSNQPTPLRQALYNAQLIVAANEAEIAHGGKPVAPRGFDLNSWRRDSATQHGSEGSYSGYDEKILYGDRSDSNYGSKASLPLYGDLVNSSDQSLQRSLSQRLTEGLRALTSATGEKQQGLSDKSAYSFDSEMQMPGAMRQAQISSTVPILTRGGGGWAVQRQQGNDEERLANNRNLQQRMPVKQHSDSTLRDSALSHDRHTLRDQGPTTAASGDRRLKTNMAGQQNNGNNVIRHKSIMIKEQAHPRRSTAATGAVAATVNGAANVSSSKNDPQRRVMNSNQKIASSTSPGSPKMLQNRVGGGATTTTKNVKITQSGQGNGAATLPSNRKPIVLNPEMPARGMTANGGQARKARAVSAGVSGAAPKATTTKQDRKSSGNTRELYRPLPMPPNFTPLDLGNGGK